MGVESYLIQREGLMKVLFFILIFLLVPLSNCFSADLFGFELGMKKDMVYSKIKNEGYEIENKWNFMTLDNGKNKLNISLNNHNNTVSFINAKFSGNFKDFVSIVKRNNENYGEPFDFFTFTVPRELVYKWKIGAFEKHILQVTYNLDDNGVEIIDFVLSDN